MSGGPTIRLQPHEVALLRGGRRAAVTVAVVALHLRGEVRAGRRGTMRTSGVAAGAGALPHLTRAVHSALYRPAGLRQLLERQGVGQAVVELRGDLVAAGLLRRVPPGRTRAARGLLKSLRGQLPLPVGREGVSPEEVLLAVALYGDRALTLLVPRFAGAAGLVGRGGSTEWGLPGPSGGGFVCGVG
ncbi:TIGR04222 domain-containing membrane protein [Streptomyces xylophagus]|uniref:TIGR04222 domain-containing membrane protein n=1 Tax=Streptomyces xylophagus TaxID=285514 RepID=UPI00068E07CA|nr:TIGR04222 domain-containing membrane protein [Streptomyces xylophagus]